ncbi:ABC transporter permease [Dyadobacter sp. CY343]|uniref:ABC transporter permease n=1 Tax=Dyadobacter sp. CY343 TaxID=2907299 RepID=UPI001F15A78E|nr:FtsX-like permease family protein [Dyadobacter sp. CY343]MCE7060793.1 ABC transporter permease [Dyadobacter sp. CY343]
MFRNYLKIAIRNLWKHKMFSLINIVGLGLAMAFCFLQLIQIQSSFEKDTFHPFPDRTYRIVTNAKGNDGKQYALASTPMPLAEKLLSDHSVIEKSARVVRNFGGNLNNGIKTLRVSGMFVDPAYFELFGFKLAKGKPCLEPRQVVLSQETAERFFGNADPVGKSLRDPELGDFTVTGVFASIKPFTTHLQSDIFVSMASFTDLNQKINTDNWLDYNAYTFVLLTKGSNRTQLDRAIAQIAEDNQKHVAFTDIKEHRFRSQLLDEISPDTENLLNNPHVEPLWKIATGLLIPLIVILLAGFNYVNLTLTRSLSRGREVGVRKVAGAKRWQLVTQFLTETVVIAFLALGIGYLGLVFMQSYIHVRWLHFEVSQTYLLWISFVVFTFLTGILAGILPARILSSYEPARIIKGEIGPAGLGKISFRKSLVVVQFVVALVFMTFTGISNSQFKYMATDNENFNRKDILNIPLLTDDFKLLVNEMSKQSDVEQIGLASATLNESAGKAKISRIGSGGKDIPAQDTYIYAADANFIDNMKLRFVAGTNLPGASADTSVHFAVVNERAASVLGFKNPKDLIGQTIMLNESKVQVSGVVKNFCFMRYELPVAPLVLAYDPSEIKILSLKIAAGAAKKRVAATLSKVWKQFHPHESFVFSWYEEQMYDNYADGGDPQFTGVIVVIVFVIAAMGLLGMVTYTTEKRTKEVGVRKVMGASVAQIMALLSGGFVRLIVIASVIALPLGYLLGALFLQFFTYHVSLGPAVFFQCAGALLLIGLGTIGVQAYRTANSNPADTLRSE